MHTTQNDPGSVTLYRPPFDRGVRLHALEELDDQLGNLLVPGHIHSHYQPIRHMPSHRLAGFEALMRPLPSISTQTPEQIFHFARMVDRAKELDFACMKAALAGGVPIPADQKLFLNANASTLLDLHSVLAWMRRHAVPMANIVLEITERESIRDTIGLVEALRVYRQHGFQFALDDVGAGYASLYLVAELQPEYVKIERLLVQRACEHPASATVMEGLLNLCAKLGIQTIAEGVESVRELSLLSDLGVPLAQGYHLGRPMPYILPE